MGHRQFTPTVVGGHAPVEFADDRPDFPVSRGAYRLNRSGGTASGRLNSTAIANSSMPCRFENAARMTGMVGEQAPRFFMQLYEVSSVRDVF